MKSLIKTRISRAIEEKIFPGCVVGIVRKNGERMVLPFGRFTYEPNASAIQKKSVFDVASITKAIPTSSLILKLIDEGKLSLEDKVIQYLPELNNSFKDEVSLRHLLTYTFILDLKSPLASYGDRTPDEILQVIFNTELQAKPGTKFLYTNSTSILLGLIAERIYGDRLDVLATRIFFEPLTMEDTSFRPVNLDQVVLTEINEGREKGEVHDESALAFIKSGKIAGSAGLFSTAPDLLLFLEMLLNKGQLKGLGYFSPEIIKLMHTNQLAAIGESAGLGWELHRPRYMGQYCTEETFGKTGFTGCVVICDIGKGVGLVMLSNTTYPKRNLSSSGSRQLSTF